MTSLEPVCDQLRTSFEPDNAMKFGLNQMTGSLESGSRNNGHTLRLVFVAVKIVGVGAKCSKAESLVWAYQFSSPRYRPIFNGVALLWSHAILIVDIGYCSVY